MVAEHYPVDDIAVRTPCELLFPLRKKLKVVAHGVAEVPVQGGTIHGMTIPEGYARVMVDRVEKGWEDLDLEIPAGDGEEELGQALHTWICWNKQYIRFLQGTTEFAERGPSLAPRSPAAQGYPSVEPPSPAAARDPSVTQEPPPPPPPAPTKKKKNLIGSRHRHLQGRRRPKNTRRKRSPRQRNQDTK